jgi:hypothetical protein
MTSTENVVRWVNAREVISRWLPNEGRTVLAGTVPCQDVTVREKIHVDGDERPTEHPGPLTYVG